MQAIHVQHLSFYYSKKHPVFRNVNLNLPAHSINLIIGPSGAGKSTFLKCLGGLFPRFSRGQTRGRISYGNRNLRTIPHSQLSQVVTMLSQDPNRQFTMSTVKDELIFTLENLRVQPRQIPITLNQSLNQLGIIKLKNRRLVTLSGGEKQQVALAIIIAMNSAVILLDEPLANVDRRARANIFRQLVELKRRGKTIVIVDHDLTGYYTVVDHTFRMDHQTVRPVSNLILKTQSRAKNSWRLPTNNFVPAFVLRHFNLRRNRKTLLNLVNLKLYQNRITLITGANGSGKSTLFQALIKLLPYQGSATYQRREIASIPKRNYYRKVCLVFQHADDQFLQVTAKEELQLSIQHAVHHFYSKIQLKLWLQQTGLIHHLNQAVTTMSGGQKKALQIIEMLLMGTPVMLMDEPFQSMDQHLTQFFINLLKRTVKINHLTLIIISHQVNGLASFFDYHLELSRLNLRYTREVSIR